MSADRAGGVRATGEDSLSARADSESQAPSLSTLSPATTTGLLRTLEQAQGIGGRIAIGQVATGEAAAAGRAA